MFLAPKTATAPAAELAYAKRHFFLPHRMRDAHHSEARPTESHVRYCRYDLMPEEAEDALGNRATVGTRAPDGAILELGHDYRVLQPSILCDENRNVSMVAFDALGMPVAATAGGKPEDDDGERLDATLKLDLTEAEIAALFDAPDGLFPAELLGPATTRSIIDPRPVPTSDAPRPSAALSLAREHHGADPGRIATSLVHFDGAGTAIQTKALRDAAEARRWACSGWVVQNNKGFPVRQFEPFFTDTHEFEFDVRKGVSPIMLYDPPGRVVATILPDKTFTKVRTTPWRAEAWDAGDTVLIPDPSRDPDVGPFIARLPRTDYLPTWHAARIDDDKGLEAQEAARQSEICSGTPAISHTDSLGRVIVSQTINRVAGEDDVISETEETSSATLDIAGRPVTVTDTLGRRAMGYTYDMAGQRIAQASNEAGRRWMLADASARPGLTWDDMGRRTRTDYDPLRRPVAVWMSQNGAPEVQIAATAHGEEIADAEARNLRGQAVETRDQSGLVAADRFDFNGKLTRSVRRIAQSFDTLLDWSGDVPLEPERFVTEAVFDALGRPILSIPPHSEGLEPHHVVQPRFDHLGQVRGLDVWHDRRDIPSGPLDPEGDPPSAAGVTDITYDARGARTELLHANGVRCRYRYDPETFRLVQLTSERPDGILQDMHYTYDATGHLTHIADAAAQESFFDGAIVGADQTFEHDARGQVVRATGRVHLGQAGGEGGAGPDTPARPLPHPNDGRALARYVEQYAYNSAGSILEMRRRIPSRPEVGWNRRYDYAEPGQIDPGMPSNRLTATHLGEGEMERIGGYDVHGSMLGLPHLAEMSWDHADRLRMTGRTVNGERTWYVYDGSGERIRKVTVDADGRLRHERLYLPGGVELFRRHGPRPLVRETLHVSDGAVRFAEVETRLAGEEPGRARRHLRVQLGNHQGSIALEVDGDARVISVQEFSPYGARTFLSVANDREAPRRAYTGQERDAETGLQRHGLRYYTPWLGLWTSADPAGMVDGPNLYWYAGNSPNNYIDPSGQYCDPNTQSCLDPSEPTAREEALQQSLPEDERYLPAGSSSPGLETAGGGASLFAMFLRPAAPPVAAPASIPTAPPGTNFAAEAAQGRRAFRAANVMPAGTQAQHWTKELSAAAANMHPDVMNLNMSPLQSRNALPATTLLFDPAGGGTTYTISGGSVYGNEHKFADRFLIPQIEDQIRAANPGATQAEVAEAAGRQARWSMTGEPGPAALPPPEAPGMTTRARLLTGGAGALNVAGGIFMLASVDTERDPGLVTAGKVSSGAFSMVGGGLELGGALWGSAAAAEAGAAASGVGLVIAVPIIAWEVGRPRGWKAQDPLLLERNMQRRRNGENVNPFCATCHGPGGALDPNNDWNAGGARRAAFERRLQWVYLGD